MIAGIDVQAVGLPAGGGNRQFVVSRGRPWTEREPHAKLPPTARELRSMVRKPIVWCVCVLGAVFAAGGAFAQATPLHLSVGESRTLELEGNPSTGYRW